MNRSKNYIKILSWDGPGYWLHAKKLPQGQFQAPMSKELLLQELVAILETPTSPLKKRGKRYRFISE
jgi:hypothetical protein